jgi:hypothetical protein
MNLFFYLRRGTTSYFQRMSTLHLESLEIRRIRIDLMTVYKILFGHMNVKTTNLFHVRQSSGPRRHRHQLTMPVNRKAVRHSFLANRIIPVWNSLPTILKFQTFILCNCVFNSSECLWCLLLVRNLLVASVTLCCQINVCMYVSLSFYELFV